MQSSANMQCPRQQAIAPRECRLEWTMACDLKVKYQEIDDLDELHRLLSANTDFDERRALRAVIRSVKEKQSAAPGSACRGPAGTADNDLSSTLPVNGGRLAASRSVSGGQLGSDDGGIQKSTSRTYERSAATTSSTDASGLRPLGIGATDDEELLRRRLYETRDYDEKKKIRAAIRDIRKKKGTSCHGQQQDDEDDEPSSLTLSSHISRSDSSRNGGASNLRVNGVPFAATGFDGSSSIVRRQSAPRGSSRPVSWAAPPPAFAAGNAAAFVPSAVATDVTPVAAASGAIGPSVSMLDLTGNRTIEMATVSNVPSVTSPRTLAAQPSSLQQQQQQQQHQQHQHDQHEQLEYQEQQKPQQKLQQKQQSRPDDPLFTPSKQAASAALRKAESADLPTAGNKMAFDSSQVPSVGQWQSVVGHSSNRDAVAPDFKGPVTGLLLSTSNSSNSGSSSVPAGSPPTSAQPASSAVTASPAVIAEPEHSPAPGGQPIADSSPAPKIKSPLVRLYSDRLNTAGKLQSSALARFNQMNSNSGIGRTSSLRIVSTRKPPKIVLPLSDTRVIDGSPASLTVGLCDVGSGAAGSVSVTWYKDGRVLKPCKEMQQLLCDQLTTARLIFDEVFPDDAGIYKCVVQNEFGQAETRARLAVDNNPLWKTPEFILGLENKTIVMGETLLLRVQVRAIPNAVLLWYREKELLDENQHMQQAFDGTTGTLSIASANIGTAGQYRCLARNSVGEQETTCKVTVTGAENGSHIELCITQGLEHITPCDGETGVYFSCTLSSAVEDARVTWSKDGKVLVSSSDMMQSFDGVKASLAFNEIFPDDEGTYTCEIITRDLMLASTAFLKVKEREIEEFTQSSKTVSQVPKVAAAAAVTDRPGGSGDVAAAVPFLAADDRRSAASQSSVDVAGACESPSTAGTPPSRKADNNNNNSSEFAGIVDEAELQKVLDSAHDYETRKKIRARLRELREAKKAERDGDRKRIDEERASEARRKLEEAEEDKKKILDKFAQLARSSSIGVRPSATDELAKHGIAQADEEKRRMLQDFQERASKDSIGAQATQQQEVLKLRVESAEQAKAASLASYQKVAKGEAELKKIASSGAGSSTSSDRHAAVPVAAIASTSVTLTKEPPSVPIQTPATSQATIANGRQHASPTTAHAQVVLRNAQSRSPAAAVASQPRPVSMVLKLDMQPAPNAGWGPASSPQTAPIASDNAARKWTSSSTSPGPTSATSLVSVGAASTPTGSAVAQSPSAQSVAVRPAAGAAQTTTPPRSASGATMSLRLEQKLEQQPPQATASASPTAHAASGPVPAQADTAPLQSRQPSALTANLPVASQTTPTRDATDGTPAVHQDSTVKTPLKVAFTPSSPTTTSGTGKTPPPSAKGAMAAFKQLDKTNNPSSQQTKPNYLTSPSTPSSTSSTPRSGGGLQRSVSDIKEMLLNWCRNATKDYQISIDNYSTSWNNGMAFCALIHHFYPQAFDYSSLDPKNRRYNFTLAFDTAEKYADIAPLLDVEDMVRMEKPDWKCVFTYVQSFYRKLRNNDLNKHQYAEN